VRLLPRRSSTPQAPRFRSRFNRWTHEVARRLDQPLERRRPALHLDQTLRPNHRPHLPLLRTHLRTGSL